MRLRNKLAVITAGGSGMGRAACLLFAREGARVAVADIDPAKVRDVAGEIRNEGGVATEIVANLADAVACRRLVDEAADGLGGLDILWNHAGIPGSGAVEDISLEDYQLAMDVNLRAGFLASAQAVRYMRKRGGGAIVFTSSTSGVAGSVSSPLYAAGKFGVVGLTMSLALRFAADRIRVNAICPGPIRTAMTPEFFRTSDQAVAAQKEKALIATVPLGRFGLPEEVAHAGLWLASDDASYVTGVALPVDGGFLAR